jgi:hypothetical protein
MILVGGFILVPILFATVQLGDLLHLWLGQNAAASAGARVAAAEGQDDDAVRQAIARSLSQVGVDPQSADIAVDPAQVAWHQPITVTITTHRRVAIPFLFNQDLALTAAFTASGEVNH